ncbi:MAG: Maf family protein [Treponema sp.]|jgi:septum formation protein|nr:Maf family protein [Treponema sp.]
MEPIILASGSLRRQEFFKLLGLPFSILPAMIDESQTGETDPQKLTSVLAVKKIQEVLKVMENRRLKWVCGADTVISMGSRIFGKPSCLEEARMMLGKLSGKQHDVTTSVALYNGQTKTTDCRSASCKVSFAPLSPEEIEWYLDTNEWQGVAGSYRIQGLAACFITGIKGSPSTVAGLPLREFYAMLRDNGYPYGARPNLH